MGSKNHFKEKIRSKKGHTKRLVPKLSLKKNPKKFGKNAQIWDFKKRKGVTYLPTIVLFSEVPDLGIFFNIFSRIFLVLKVKVLAYKGWPEARCSGVLPEFFPGEGL